MQDLEGIKRRAVVSGCFVSARVISGLLAIVNK